MTQTKPTPGPWVYVAIDGSIINPNGINDNKDSWHVAELTSNDGCLAANGNLIAEAGTVYHETKRTPKQLATENSELRIMLGRFIAQFTVGNLDGDNTVKADLLGQAYKLIEEHSND